MDKYYLFCKQREQPYGGWEDLEAYTLQDIFNILYNYHSIDHNLDGYTLQDLLDFEWGIYSDSEFKKEADYSKLDLSINN